MGSRGAQRQGEAPHLHPHSQAAKASFQEQMVSLALCCLCQASHGWSSNRTRHSGQTGAVFFLSPGSGSVLQSEADLFDCTEWPSRCWDTFHKPHCALGRASLCAHWARGLCSLPLLLPGQSNELGLSLLEWSGRNRTPSSPKITLEAMLHLFRGNYFSSPFRKKHTAKLTLPCSVTL